MSNKNNTTFTTNSRGSREDRFVPGDPEKTPKPRGARDDRRGSQGRPSTLGERKCNEEGLARELGELHGVEQLLGVSAIRQNLSTKRDDVKVEVGGGNMEVRETALERANKLSDIEAPEEGGETATFREALVDLNEGVRGVETMRDADFDGQVSRSCGFCTTR